MGEKQPLLRKQEDAAPYIDATVSQPKSASTTTTQSISVTRRQCYHDASASSPQPTPSPFLSLPPEIHLHIASNLGFSDALSLKDTNRYFYGMLDVPHELKLEWLISRRRLHAQCPHVGPCILGQDMDFCRGSVKLLMERRWGHEECRNRVEAMSQPCTVRMPWGCLVTGERVCRVREVEMERKSGWRDWFARKGPAIDAWERGKGVVKRGWERIYMGAWRLLPKRVREGLQSFLFVGVLLVLGDVAFAGTGLTFWERMRLLLPVRRENGRWFCKW